MKGNSARYSELEKNRNSYVDADGRKYYLKRNISSSYITDEAGNELWRSAPRGTLLTIAAYIGEVVGIIMIITKAVASDRKQINYNSDL